MTSAAAPEAIGADRPSRPTPTSVAQPAAPASPATGSVRRGAWLATAKHTETAAAASSWPGTRPSPAKGGSCTCTGSPSRVPTDSPIAMPLMIPVVSRKVSNARALAVT